MATKPDVFPALAEKRASSPEVVKLFAHLTERTVALAQMQDDLIKSIIQHREVRTGKKFRYTKRQQKDLDEFDSDAVKAREDQEKLVEKMDDAALLSAALSGEQMELRLDENMLSSYRAEDQKKPNEIIAFRRGTIKLIEGFVEQSEFKGKVKLLSIMDRKSKHGC